MASVEFPPARNRGLTLHFSLIILFILLTVIFILLVNSEPIGLRFALFILIALLTFIPIPILAYRLYALSQAMYSLDRDRLNISWGLRLEQIPISEIEWVRPLPALSGRLSLPFIYLPGSILGFRRNPDLGNVEFLASDKRSLLLIATSRQVIAISPENAQGFLQNIQRAMELGGVTPVASRSIKPTVIIEQAWKSTTARYFWMAGLFLNIGFLVWVSLVAPTLGNIPLGFIPSGAPREPIPGIGLILLPVVSTLLNLGGWITGLILFRRENTRIMAIVVWASGVISTLLFLSATFLIVTTPA
jgi:hypothetical protein